MPNQSTGLFTPDAAADPGHLHGFDWGLEVYAENGARGLRRHSSMQCACSGDLLPLIRDESDLPPP